ncbi:tetratricopeptide repeat protein [Qipengyuania nanhaisediminis]|uniref:tetratricopeptide repeat protein n=1 Tax=Qipengyuania nanhaisediminis TaxID=604088 RepID=UPI0038B3ABA9
MPRRAALLAAGALALALAGCANEDSASERSALTGTPDFLELVEDARVAVRGGALAEAGRLYDEALAIDPQSPGLWVDIARLRFRGGEHLLAIEAADHALALDPAFAPALLMRAQLVRDAHGHAEALPWFEAAIAADPANGEALADHAATLGELGRYRAMLAAVRRLAEVDTGAAQVPFFQAVLAARANDPVLASTLIDRSGLSQRGVAAAMMLDAIVNLQQGNHDTAAETLEQLAERMPANIRVNELLARSLWLGGRDREIIDRFAERAAKPQASPYLVMLVGRAFERSGDRERALSLIERALVPREAAMIGLEATRLLPEPTATIRTALSAGNTAAARRASERYLARWPSSGDVHLLAGDAAFAGGDIERALEYYGTAARVRRSAPLARKLFAATRAFGDTEAAEALLVRAARGDPQNPDLLFLLAQLSAEREDWLRVAVLLDTAIGLGAASDLGVLALRAEAAEALGDREEAARFDALRRALKPGPFAAR